MLEFKRISDDTLDVMRNALGSGVDYYSSCTDKLRDFLGGGQVHILNSANSCLLVVAEAVEEPILVCDEGGWNGFIKSCKVFGKNVEYMETDYALIDIEELSDYFDAHDVKTFYITSLAAYTAKQPLDEISMLCKIHEVTLIVDISGSVGDEKLNMYGDLQVSSTGKPKIINIENGGFINNRTKNIELNKHLLRTLKADNTTCAGIENELDKAVKIQEKTIETNKYLKGLLEKKLEYNEEYHIIHPDKEGINTIIEVPSKSKAKKLAYNIRRKIETTGNIITTGPTYNRIKKPSIIVEVKNVDINSLNRENMQHLSEVIIEEIENMMKTC